MIIIGIDPGTALTGYAVLEVSQDAVSPLVLIKEVSAIKTSKDTHMHYRLKELHEQLMEITAKFQPSIMIIERLFFNTNVKTAMTVGQARGVPLLVAAAHKMHVYEYTALEAKMVVTGYGRADKKQVQEAVKTILKLDDVVKPDDANDAIAMALCFLNKDFRTYLEENAVSQ